MECRQWVVNSFTDRSFGGNPAAVVLLDQWIGDRTLAAIAAQNRYSETAFLVPSGRDWELRWFTPTTEVDLCGHATLAAAWCVMEEISPSTHVEFHTRWAGVLAATREGRTVWLDFPSRPPRRVEVDDTIRAATGLALVEAWLARDLLLVLESEEQVRDYAPDLAGIASLQDIFAIVPTAPSRDGTGFVSRYFAPNAGIPEDPVTGSSHATLIPFWSGRLGSRELTARQLSPEGGTIFCRDLRDRVGIGGHVAPFLRGDIAFAVTP